MRTFVAVLLAVNSTFYSRTATVLKLVFVYNLTCCECSVLCNLCCYK